VCEAPSNLQNAMGRTAAWYWIERDDRRDLFAGWTKGPDSGELGERFLTFGVVTFYSWRLP
jgi:hypothetical protein